MTDTATTATTTTGLVAYRTGDTVEWGISTVTQHRNGDRVDDITSDYVPLLTEQLRWDDDGAEDPLDAAHRTVDAAQTAARRVLGDHIRFDAATYDGDPAALTTWTIR